jgi:hypothetical protein
VFNGDLTREYYLNGAGLKEELSLAPIFERHAGLFAADTVAALQQAGDGDPRFPALRAFVVEGHLENAVKGLSETLAARETADAAAWAGREVPYRALPVLIANEAEAESRHELDALRVGLTGEQNALREERWDILQAAARTLGYPHYVALCDDIGRLGLEALQEQAKASLWSSDGRYRSLLWRYLEGIGVAPVAAERSDLAFLFRSPRFDSHFPADLLIASLRETLRGLGIDLDAQTSVRLDTEARPQKSPRAFCAPIAIPDEVMLVINPHGGQDDYSALLHEAGHAEHFAHADRRLPFALRGLGDNSVTEAFAFLLEHLMQNAVWLERYLGWSDAEEFITFKRFFNLYIWRRYCAKLVYELELHMEANPRSKAKRYCDLLTSCLGVRYNAADYLFDVDDGFYCARYLRAWMFEAQLRRHLEEEFGREWFLRREAGAHLRELWSLGQSLPVGELARRVGYAGLDAAPLEEELRA